MHVAQYNVHMQKRVMITGCAGFIGSNLTNKCLAEGWDVVGVDDLSGGREEFLPETFVKDTSRFMRCDFVDPKVLRLVDAQRFDAVVHLAAIPRVSYSIEYPVSTNEANVSKTLLLMQVCRDNIERFVFSSSSSVYGGADVLPTPVSHPKDPKSPYALQKSIIEDYLKIYSNFYGLDSVSLRFFNVFGPNQLGSSPYSTVISAWLNAALSRNSMRSDGDGSQSRDMCYVDNVVDACIRAASYSGKLNAQPLNVACGDRVTNSEILNYFKKKFPNATSHNAPWRPGDVMHTQADITNTTEVLGYVPSVRFWEGLDLTTEWYIKSWETIKDM